jgi:uncharacterized protein (UPF0332 family)
MSWQSDEDIIARCPVLGHAVKFLREAESSPATDRPRMAIHAAYYPMFHAARAVLVKLEGTAAPNKHDAVASRFGYHTNQAGDAHLTAAARSLRKVQEARMNADYRIDADPDPAAGGASVAEARRFLEACATWQNFTPP